MSSQSLSPPISGPYKLKPRSSISKATKPSSTSPATTFTSKRSCHYKRKIRWGRRFLDLLNKNCVPCASSIAGREEDPIDDFPGVIDISTRFIDGDLASALPPEREDSISLPSVSSGSPSTVGTTLRCTPGPRIGNPSIGQPFTTKGHLSYKVNDGPTRANIYDLSIYGYPTPVNNFTPRLGSNAPKGFSRVPLNIYNASHNAAAKSAKDVPPIIVDSEQVSLGASPVYVVARGLIREAEASLPLDPSGRLTRPFSCNFPSRSISTIPKYIMRDDGAGVTLSFNKRKRFVTYKHLQTLPIIKEEGDENDSCASDVDSVPSDVNSNSPPAAISVKYRECEADVKPLSVNIGVPRSRGKVTGRAVVSRGNGRLHSHSFPLSFTYTAKRPSPLDARPSGLRPVLLPIHVILRDPAIHGQKSPRPGPGLRAA